MDSILRKLVLTVNPFAKPPLPRKGHGGRAHAGMVPVSAHSGGYLLDDRRVPELKADDEHYAIAYKAISDIFACILIRAEAVSRLPVRVYDERTGDELLVSAWHNAVNYARKAFNQDVFFHHEWALSIWGETYWVKLVQPNGVTPGGIQWLNPVVTRPQVEDGIIEYFEYSGGDGNYQRFLPPQIGYDYYLNPSDDLRGLSPVRTALDAANIKRNAQAFINAYFVNDARPGGIITGRSRSAAFGGTPIPLSEDEVEMIIEQWKAQNKGARDSFKINVLPWDLELQTFDNNPPTSQIDLTDDQRRNMHQSFRVPMALTGASDTSDPLSSVGTLSKQEAGFWDRWVIPEHRGIVDWFNTHIMPWLSPGHYLQGDYQEIIGLIEDTAERRDMLRADLNAGVITVNEYRMKTGEEPFDDGDVLFLPSGALITPVNQLGQVTQYNPALVGAGQGETPVTVEEETIIPGELSPLLDQDVLLLPPPPVGAVLDRSAILGELNAWRRYIVNRMKNNQTPARPFTLAHIPHHFALDVEAAIAGITDPVKINAVFADFREEYKDIQARLLDFEEIFTDIVAAAQAGEITRRRFSSTLRAEIRRFGQLFYSEGLIDGGVLDGIPNEAETTEMNNLIAKNTGFVTSLGEQIYKQGITDEQAAQKTGMWSNKLMELYQAGLASANGNQMLLFTGEDGLQSCRTCKALKGQIHRAKKWKQRELRPGIDRHNYQCGAWQCRHMLKPVISKAVGTLPTEAAVQRWARQKCAHHHEFPPMDEQPYTQEEYDLYIMTEGHTEFSRSQQWARHN